MKSLNIFGYLIILLNIILLFTNFWWLLLTLPLSYLCFRYDLVYYHLISRKPKPVDKKTFTETIFYCAQVRGIHDKVFSQWWTSRHFTIPRKLLSPEGRLIYLATLDLVGIYLKNGGSRTDLYNERGAYLLVLIDLFYRDFQEDKNEGSLSIVKLDKYYSKYHANVLEMIKHYESIKSANSEYNVETNGFYCQIIEAEEEYYSSLMKQFLVVADLVLRESNQVSDYFKEMLNLRSKSIADRMEEIGNNMDYEDDFDERFNDEDSDEDENEKDVDPYDLPDEEDKPKNRKRKNSRGGSVSIDEVMKELNALTGLETVKKELQTFINTIKVQNKKRAMNLPVQSLSYHCVFTGSPGTGKTTVARIMAKAFKALGLISNGELIESSRKDFVAGYTGQTAIKTNQIMDRAKGNVLFIDEAYQMVSGDNDSFGEEAVAELIARMENDRNDLIVIIAGYDAEITQFLSTNPGLKSRFNRYIHFEDYNATDLAHIFYKMAKSKSYIMSDEVVQSLKDLMNQAYNRRGKDFGNARYVRNFFEKCVEEQANRLAESSTYGKEELLTLTKEDLFSAFKKVNI